MFDIAIIGYGPAGATLANLLGQAGLSVLVLEKEAGIYLLPRAIHFDGEVMRIFQAAGLRPAVEAISRPGLKGMHFVNAEGETLNDPWRHGRPGVAWRREQPLLPPARARAGAAHRRCALCQCAGAVAPQGHADRRGRRPCEPDRNQPASSSAQVQARYVVGYDGARSMVRKLLGSPMKDLGLRQPWAGAGRHPQRQRPRAARPHGAVLRPGPPHDPVQRHRPPSPLGDHADAGRRPCPAGAARYYPVATGEPLDEA